MFHDRLTNDEDRTYFYKVLSDELHNGFKVRWAPKELEKDPLLFGDFLEVNSPHAPRVYRFVRSYDRLPKILEVSERMNSQELQSCHVNKVCLPSQSAPGNHNQKKESPQTFAQLVNFSNKSMGCIFASIVAFLLDRDSVMIMISRVVKSEATNVNS